MTNHPNRSRKAAKHTPPKNLRVELEPYPHLRDDDGAIVARDLLDVDKAAFIVRACNSHEALVEALEFALTMALPEDGPEATECIPPTGYEWEQLRIKARAALKLAKGE